MPDRENIIFEAARLHFEVGLKQDEVARILKVSRPTAARYLAIAREMGYVQVRVLQPESHTFLHDLERELIEQFPTLREALLTASRPESLQPGQPAAQRAVADELAERAAERFDAIVTSRHRTTPPVVAVARGEMIDAVIRRIRPSQPMPELEALPMLGYLRTREYSFDANRLAQELARLYAGDYQWIPAPAVVTDAEARVLRKMELVAEPLRRLSEDVNLVLTSISCPYQTQPDGSREVRQTTLLQSGRVTAEQVEQAARCHGVIGEICGWQFNADGIVPLTGVTILGLDVGRLPELARDPERSVMAVAGGDPDRFDAVYAALRLALINVLVTDYLTAHRLIERRRQERAAEG